MLKDFKIMLSVLLKETDDRIHFVYLFIFVYNDITVSYAISTKILHLFENKPLCPFGFIYLCNQFVSPLRFVNFSPS
jgi:hypothetical protein